MFPPDFYKSRHNIGNRKVSEKVITYNESVRAAQFYATHLPYKQPRDLFYKTSKTKNLGATSTKEKCLPKHTTVSCLRDKVRNMKAIKTSTHVAKSKSKTDKVDKHNTAKVKVMKEPGVVKEPKMRQSRSIPKGPNPKNVELKGKPSSSKNTKLIEKQSQNYIKCIDDNTKNVKKRCKLKSKSSSCVGTKSKTTTGLKKNKLNIKFKVPKTNTCKVKVSKMDITKLNSEGVIKIKVSNLSKKNSIGKKTTNFKKSSEN